ncbi:hypothetical protein [Nonomuraea angiospora]
MNRLNRLSFGLGAAGVNLCWMVNYLLTAEDVHTMRFAVYLVLAVAFGVLTVWIARELRKKRTTAYTPAHIDTEGVYAAVRCSGCGDHLLYVEHGHDLVRLTSARDRHACKSVNAR